MGTQTTPNVATTADAEGWQVGLPTAAQAIGVGSAFLFGSGADVDVLVLWDEIPTIELALAGWALPRIYGNTPFISFTKGKVNLICTEDASLYAKYAAAQAACEVLALAGVLSPVDKAGRIAVFDAIKGAV